MNVDLFNVTNDLTILFSGLGLGLAYLPAIVSVSYYFEKRRAFATGIAVCGSGVGTFVFAPLTAVLIEHYGWKGAMLICAGILLNCVVMGALFRPLESVTLDVSIDTDDEDEDEVKPNGGINGGPKMNIPNIRISSASVTSKDVDPLAERRLISDVDRQISSSAHALPFMSQPSGLHKDPIYKKNIKRHASETMLHRRKHIHIEEHAHKSPGPMARKDIFYRASLQNIPMYKSDHDLYTQSMLSLPGDVDENDVCCCLKCCAPNVQQSLSEMIDLDLLLDPVFMLFAISNLLTSIGFCVPYAYVPDRAAMHGVTKTNAAFLLAVIGIANMVGRVLFGWIADRERVNRLMLYNSALVLCGLFTAFSIYCDTFVMMVVYCAGFGMFIGE